MTRFKRKLVYGLIGLLAGVLAWGLSTLPLMLAGWFPSFLGLSLTTGFLLGASLGAYFGSLEGLTQSVPQKVRSGIRMGLILGGLGGIAGFLLGQGFLLYLGDYFLQSAQDLRRWGLPLSKVVGWVVLGSVVGMIEGWRSLSWAKIRVGLLGGALGGLLGGLALELLPLLVPQLAYADLVGLCLLGLMIGLAFALVEAQFSVAVLRLLNGPFKGKEYLLLAKTNRVGQAPQSEICLKGYKEVEPQAAKLVIKKGRVQVVGEGKTLKVNDRPPGTEPLSPEDILQVGSAKLIFYYR